MDENYTDAHRAFLQACARLSVLSQKQAFDILQSIRNKCKLIDFLLKKVL